MAVKQEKLDDSHIRCDPFKLPPKILDAELEAIRCRRRAVRCSVPPLISWTDKTHHTQAAGCKAKRWRT